MPQNSVGHGGPLTMVNSRFDAEKALEVLIYVTQKCRDMYKALKIVYFADKLHLGRYGRLIAGDRYVAMLHGPVPSGLYDIVKFVRGDGVVPVQVPAQEAFTMVDKETINPLREPNVSLLSETDRECLDEAIHNYAGKSFDEIQRLSHDVASKAADRNDSIPIEEMAKTHPESEALLEYLRQ